MDKHRCGGTLNTHKVQIRKKIGSTIHKYLANGHKCDSCGEEVISRDVALELEELITQKRVNWNLWRMPSESIITKIQYSIASGTNQYIPENEYSFDTGK